MNELNRFINTLLIFNQKDPLKILSWRFWQSHRGSWVKLSLYIIHSYPFQLTLEIELADVVMSWSDHNTDSVGSLLWTTDVPRDACNLLYASVSYDTPETGQKPVGMWFMACTVHFIGLSGHFSRQFSFLPRSITCSQQNPSTKKNERKKK